MNKETTNLFCSRNVHPKVDATLSQNSGFSVVPDLGKYLGIPLHHKRVYRWTFQFIKDKLRTCLNKWKANFLSLAGRITLAKSVLNTIPVYYMQTNLLPFTVCDSIDRISKDFIWDSGDERKGTNFIAWEKLCYPKNCSSVSIRKVNS